MNRTQSGWTVWSASMKRRLGGVTSTGLSKSLMKCLLLPRYVAYAYTRTTYIDHIGSFQKYFEGLKLIIFIVTHDENYRKGRIMQLIEVRKNCIAQSKHFWRMFSFYALEMTYSLWVTITYLSLTCRKSIFYYILFN